VGANQGRRTLVRTSGRDLFAWLGRREVVLQLPHPLGECMSRLAKVTTDRGSSWYLDSRTAMQPDPRFRGVVFGSSIRIARFSQAAGRNSFVPWLEGQIEPAAGGHAVFTGRVGPDPAVRVMVVIFVVVATLVVPGAAAGVVSLIAAGHVSDIAPVILIPGGLAALVFGMAVGGRRYVAKEIPRLIREVNTVLDGTASAAGA
jgi:hypothetical protein